MTALHNETPQWRRRYGITSGNPFAPFIIGLTIIAIASIIITLVIAFVGKTANDRWIAGIVFMFVGALAPIPIGLLIMYSRHYVRIQDIKAGDYWAHWEYPADSGNREIFIGPNGIYYPSYPLRLTGFWSGLQNVEVKAGEPATLNIQFLSRQYYSAMMPPLTSNKMLVIPIPSGKEGEAEALLPKFKQMIGQPSDFVNDQWRIGWIMAGAILGFVLLSIPLLFSVQLQYDDAKRAFLNATATMDQATEVAQVTVLSQPIRAVMEKQIEHLKTLPDGTMTAEEAGFEPSAGVSAVYYGHCLPDNAFYLYVILTTEALNRRYLGGPGAFNYTTATDWRYMDCGPEHLISTVPDKLDGGWYYAVIARIASTRTPRIIDTTTPTATAFLKLIETDLSMITIQNKDWQVGILPETGASIAFGRIRHNDEWVDVMRPTPESDWGNSSNCSSFVMLPWCNRIKDGVLRFEDKTYQLKTTKDDCTARHGDVRKRNWTVDKIDANHIHMSLKSTDFPDMNWPFKFSAQAEYRLG